MKIRANGIQVEVEDSGDVSRPPVLLVMGLGMQLIAWPQALVDALVDAGYRVIRHDNRDIGLSQHFDELGVPNLALAAIKHKLGMRLHPPYTLIDMAKDALGVLDALAIPQAHVVGVSMGGMIAQRMAIAAPGRVLSLTSVMSSSGARRLPSAEPRVLRAMLGRPANASHEAAIDHTTALFRLIGSPGFPLPEAELRERVRLSVARSHHPAGISRQMLAVVADDRASALPKLRCPTLVVHGKADPLVPFACGEDTASRIPGAQLVGVEGMGHDLPPGVVQRLLAALLPFLKSATAR